jgi:transcription antitermination protein NusB
MLSRRHLRIKVLQAMYAYFQDESADLAKSERLLFQSIDKLYELVIYQLSFLIEIRDFAHNRSEENKKKYFPTEDDLNPNMRFVENRLLKKLENNREYLRMHKQLRINWADEQGMVRKAYIEMRGKSFYKTYMSQTESSFANDRDFAARLVRKVLTEYELLEQFFEDKSVFWAFDSYYTASMLLVKLLKMIRETDDDRMPLPALLSTEAEKEDREFMVRLWRKTIMGNDTFEKMIDEKASNWEIERIALMDVILIKMALAELVEFPTIPVKVTLNEYIDISKYYSSEKSKVFINGILDKLIADMKASSMIVKTGRGLLES